MGTSVQKINENVSLIASKETWIEGLAIDQLLKTSELTGMHRVAGMPDLHPGRGYPIGAAFFTTNKIYPALVGNDIGCGMSLWQTSAKVSKVNLDKLVKKFVHVEQPLDDSWSSIIEGRKLEKDITTDRYDRALGTIGGGNHFAEFQAIDEVYDQAVLDELGLNKKHLQLLYTLALGVWGSPFWLSILRNITTMVCNLMEKTFRATCTNMTKRFVGLS